MPDRDFLSIGEVLDLLKPEFPDITISKIRFLESQGLLEPERTPSGYRKFFPPDVDRLRWILQQQRENFLPLKVIKGRLNGDSEEPLPVAVAKAERAAPSRALGAAASRRMPSPRSFVAPDEPPSDMLNREQLLEASGLSVEALRDFVRYGLIEEHKSGLVAYYDADSVAIACTAAGFLAFGVEARHLRMYKTSADREAAFFEQVVTPLLNKRNPEARSQAVDTVDELARLGEELRAAMLRRALRPATGGR